MLEDLALGEILEGAGIAAEGALGTGLTLATGVVGVLTGGVVGTALVFGAGFLLGRRVAAGPRGRSTTRQARPIEIQR